MKLVPNARLNSPTGIASPTSSRRLLGNFRISGRMSPASVWTSGYITSSIWIVKLCQYMKLAAGSMAHVQNSIISEGGVIEGEVDFSVLFSDVTVEEGATVHDSILMPGAVVKKGACVQYAILAENAVVEEGATVGARPEDMINTDEWGVAVVAAGIRIGAGAVVPAKAMRASR